MNRPTQFLIVALFIAAGATLALATSAAVHALAEFPQPLPFPVAFTKPVLPPNVVTLYDVHHRPVGTAVVTSSRPIVESAPTGQLIPTQINGTTELIPTHWNHVNNVLIHH